MCGAIPTLPQYAFMAWYLVKHREKFTFTYPFLWHSTENRTGESLNVNKAQYRLQVSIHRLHLFPNTNTVFMTMIAR
jgi:Fe-S cluster assembly scaffold protein SufB